MKNRRITVKRTLIALLLVTASAGLQGQPQEPAYGSIDGILAALYGSIGCGPGRPPRTEVMRTLYLPEARLVRMTKDGSNRMDLDGFLSSFLDRIRKGEIQTFVEEEIARRTEAFGSIAQVFSVYRKGLNTMKPEEFVRGINSLQLINDGRRWWIVSIIWQDETPDHPIPDIYFKK